MASRDVEHSAVIEGHEAKPRPLFAAFAVPPAAQRPEFPDSPFPPAEPAVDTRAADRARTRV
jgi:hypothetical protein